MGRAGAGGGMRGGGGGGMRSSGGRSSGGFSAGRTHNSGGSSSSSSHRSGFSGSSSSLGSSSHRSGFSGSSSPSRPSAPPPRPMSGGYGYNPPPPPPPHHHHNRTVFVHDDYPMVTHRHHTSFGTIIGAVTTLIIVIVILCLLISAMAHSSPSPDAGYYDNQDYAADIYTPTTVADTRVRSEYYEDDLAWLQGTSSLLDALDNFENITGVAPFILITDNIDGNYEPSDNAYDKFAPVYYESNLSTSDMLIIFQEYNGVYSTWVYMSDWAIARVGGDRVNTLLDSIDNYYFSDMTEDELFASAVNDAARR